jgi:predicted GIY-YIG superfamily endonuclease
MSSQLEIIADNLTLSACYLILLNIKVGTYYYGHTKNIGKRVQNYNSGKCSITKGIRKSLQKVKTPISPEAEKKSFLLRHIG